MKTETKTLLLELKNMVNSHLLRTTALSNREEAALLRKPTTAAWNALECIEHLNRYGEFYIPELKSVIANSTHPSEPVFESGYLGNRAALSMLPSDAGLNTMRTFKSKNPSIDGVRPGTIAVFQEQQYALLQVLNLCKNLSLNRNRCRLTLPLLKFKLGDALRFVIYHNERHMQQAERAAGLR